MRNMQRLNMLLLGVTVSSAVLSPAYSRNWKPTSVQLANDYANINHARSKTDFVTIRWWAAPTFQPGTPVAQLLDKFVVLSVVHFHVQSTGTFSFDNIATLAARDSSGMPLGSYIRRRVATRSRGGPDHVPSGVSACAWETRRRYEILYLRCRQGSRVRKRRNFCSI